MNVIFTCGGTAGHVNPALALARYMQEKDPATKVLFVGTPNGMERGLVEKAGYDFAAVEVSNFRRSLSPEGLRHNFKTARTLVTSRREADAIIRDFKPDLVVGTGGYASYPAVKAAARRRIPTAVHESNMIPGLTTKLLEGCVDCVMVGFEDCRRHYKHPDKVAVTGTPVRGDFFELTKEQARQKLGYTDDKPLVASFWGSLGASTMNQRMLDFFLLEREAVCLIRSRAHANTPLDQMRYIGRDSNPEHMSMKARWLMEHGLEPTSALNVDGLSACVSMVQAGLGWSIVPEICLSYFDGLSEPLFFADGTPLTRSTYLLYRKREYELPQVREFIRIICAHSNV